MNVTKAKEFCHALLIESKYPNCTLYLIWHYLKKGEVENARSEFVRDSDKLGLNRGAVSQILEMNEGKNTIKSK
jgi:hypothetical protein